MKLGDILFPIQKVTIPKTEETLGLELEATLKEEEQLYSIKRDAIQNEIFEEMKKKVEKQFVQLNAVLVKKRDSSGTN